MKPGWHVPLPWIYLHVAEHAVDDLELGAFWAGHVGEQADGLGLGRVVGLGWGGVGWVEEEEVAELSSDDSVD